ncbi:metal ABC transporter substrate-binding protein [Actinobacillus delphinicola]|uniref:Iron (Chelated) ABC transporter, periplasmic-binding protein n=1 Tax=Actinobacillus delphinicola TaxID=51161 RepID=A0A448TW38_9PAST|nr:metal ABC transporter substrate-binding protein [Actinobacillus delphinicola]VEJ10141.1 iron (chelated) ABC transporter, periplasmic-binding protein [Actinobacillus delphinicola]
MRYLLTLLFVFYTASVSAKLNVITTFTILQDIAQNVGGDKATVKSITKAGAEIHQYQPTPKDIIKAQNADLILWNGLYLESWFERFFENMPPIPSVVVTEGIQPLSIYKGPYKGKPNPHAWMSPQNAILYVNNIRDAFIKYDPENAETYRENARNYIQKIEKLDQKFQTVFSKIPEQKRYLATSEGAFGYLAKHYHLKEAYLWSINAEQQGTPQQVKELIDLVRANQIPVIFSESTISDKPAKQVAHESGAKYGGVLYVDSLSTSKGPVPTYLDLLDKTITTIAQGFGVYNEK